MAVSRSILVGAIIVCILIGFGIGFAARPVIAPPPPKVVEKIVEVEVKPPELEGTIYVGAIIPLTGIWGYAGENSKVAMELAVEEFNAWLKMRGRKWEMEIIYEDTMSDPKTALEKMKALHGRGIKFFIGPMTSGEAKECKEYADANKIFYNAHGSTSPALSIPGDFLYRFAPDDTIQGPAIARLTYELGVRHVIQVWVRNPWGEGLARATAEAFEKIGGTVYEEIEISYPEGATDFPTEAATLKDAVESLIARGIPKEEIGIQTMSYEEIGPLMEDAAEYDILWEVTWIGSDASALAPILVGEIPVASEFAIATNFICTVFAPGTARYPRMEQVKRHIEETLGRTPDPYAYLAYDAVWTLGIALDTIGEYDAEKVLKIFPENVKTWSYYNGASGYFELNENGDRAWADYALWAVEEVVEGEWKWVRVGTWVGATDTIEWIK
jgi:branched-chain amino acid transport system substrate-binding protein